MTSRLLCQAWRMTWPTAPTLHTARFVLEPLAVQHAEQMVDVLAAQDLYLFTGGEPPTLDGLRAQYSRQSAGHSPANDAGWLNWIVRASDPGTAIGYIQATLTLEDGALIASMAWLITPAAQGVGAAAEAALAATTWLQTQHVADFRALIHPDHVASEHVARHLGLQPTPRTVDGETVWQTVGGTPA